MSDDTKVDDTNSKQLPLSKPASVGLINNPTSISENPSPSCLLVSPGNTTYTLNNQVTTCDHKNSCIPCRRDRLAFLDKVHDKMIAALNAAFEEEEPTRQSADIQNSEMLPPMPDSPMESASGHQRFKQTKLTGESQSLQQDRLFTQKKGNLRRDSDDDNFRTPKRRRYTNIESE